ncbi:MAG: VOC family protein [Acidimicrobiales bacterium]
MPDPFEALRSPVAPVEPDPDFAAALRARVERALVLPEGVIVSQTTLPPDQAGARAPARPRGADAALGLTPYLIVADSRRAMDWYVEVFGARRRGEPMVMADGRIGHAELDLGRGQLYLADEAPASGGSQESRVAAPRPGADATVSFVIEMPDVDAAVGRAAEAGATVERAAADNPYGRNAVVRDPFGHRWIISVVSERTDPTAPGAEPMPPGDVGYVSLWVPDVARAEAFFGSVLGWSFAPGSGGPGRQVADRALPHGLWGGVSPATLFLCYLVDDVDAAVIRVRAAGGEAREPTDAPFGRVAECVDDQGTAFAVFRPLSGEPGPRLAEHGTRQGDVAYISVEVVDSARTRAFYGAVLGWRVAPGRVEDGWQVEGVRPGTGISGGHTSATAVPLYLVDDIDAAVRRVRAAGGTATDPERQPYGVTSNCVDDQGTRFSLGEL